MPAGNAQEAELRLAVRRQAPLRLCVMSERTGEWHQAVAQQTITPIPHLVAGGRAWLPGKGWGGPRYRLRRVLPGGIIPRDVRKRYASALSEGKIVVVAAADGQPPDTIAALLHQARGEAVDQWWQQPTYIFAPPELAGPF